MKVQLADNIKRFRKDSGMTQEQLAEAMGVSVSAVYKWESGLSNPDIRLILELADLFHTSTDVLLGYRWQNRNAEAVIENIITHRKERDYETAAAEAEKGLRWYPNDFNVVYQSALVYMEWGENCAQREVLHRAIDLLEHACGLAD